MSTLNIASFNIRYDTPNDGPNAWPNRKERVRALLDYHEIALLGVQEALAHQLDYLTESGSRFDFVGVGRDDAKRAGEFSAVLYDRKRLQKRDGGTFWLSETPDKPSKGWDAQLNRICSWARLRDREGGDREFFLFNTHFDHRGVVARERSADVILAKIESIAGKEPAVLTGDFNLTPDTAPIKKLASALRDAREASERKSYGPAGTFNGFDLQRPLEAPIDYIFVNRRVRVLKHAVLPDNWDQRYPSDHCPVAATIEFLP
ncbi:MAG TPA: endonuclease/exonuclease/phosphatase family protein [Armatimonadaceae bacterium]|nr:endonuclease/exonuclease/phosphatase family protein [Armatimonadaceae bacterium]